MEQLSPWRKAFDRVGAEIVNLRQIIGGAKSLLFKSTNQGTGGTISPTYCYAVWMRHLALCWQSGMDTLPSSVVEIGPGDSLGTGLAALLCGAHTLYAFDSVQHTNVERNLEILSDLVSLFERRIAIPSSEFPRLSPRLPDYGFPRSILPDEKMAQNLDPARVEAIRQAVKQSVSSQASPVDGILIRYIPSQGEYAAMIKDIEVEMIFSQAVMQYEQDLERAYTVYYQRLKPQGWMSHQIDFSAHETSGVWNGHWSYSDFTWRIICGAQPYYLSRNPMSVHVQRIQEAGFELVTVLQNQGEGGIERSRLAERYRALSDEDLRTRNAFLVARKPEALSFADHDGGND
jgi:hypothetical protein